MTKLFFEDSTTRNVRSNALGTETVNTKTRLATSPPRAFVKVGVDVRAGGNLGTGVLRVFRISGKEEKTGEDVWEKIRGEGRLLLLNSHLFAAKTR